MATKQHYVNNLAFLEAFKKYLPIVRPLRRKYEDESIILLTQGMKKKDLPKFKRPQTSDYDYIGECLLKIAEHLSLKPNFSKYTFREEMIGDALENAILYLENFNPEKYSNPFAYFTQIMKWAFIRRIAREEKNTYIIQKSLENARDFYSTQTGDDGGYANTYVDFIKDVKGDIITNFEEKKKAKKSKNSIRVRKQKVVSPGIDKFLIEV